MGELFFTDLVGERISLSMPFHDQGSYRLRHRTVVRGRIRAVTVRNDVMHLWIEIETHDDAYISNTTDEAIGEVWDVPTDTGNGVGIIRILKKKDET